MAERGVREDIAKAAKRAGYFPHEIEALLANPDVVLASNEREKLRFTLSAADAFVRIMQGNAIDHRQLVRFANQLRDIAGAPTDDEKLVAWKKTHDVFEDSWEGGEKEKLEIDFTFEEEQKLLLVKNLLEEAFFRGDLAQLTGESAGAIAFFANRLGKVVSRMTPGVRDSFGFNKKRFDRLLSDASAYYNDHYGHQDNYDSLRAEQQVIVDEIFTTDDPRVVRYKELEADRTTMGSGWDMKKFVPEYLAKLQDGAGLLLLQFDTIVPSNTPNAAKVKELLRKSYAGISDESSAKNALTILGYENVSPAYAFSHAVKGRSLRSREKRAIETAAAQSNADKKLLQQFVVELRKITGKQKKSVDALVEFIHRMISDPEGELGELCVKGRLQTMKDIEKEELYAAIMNSPLNPELLVRLNENRERVDAVQSREETDIVDAQRGSSSSIRIARINEMPGEFSLYFIKDYMVAVDKFAKEGFKPEDYFIGHYWGNGKSIATHSFSDTRNQGLFSDVHYREEFLPVAESIVAMQKAARD